MVTLIFDGTTPKAIPKQVLYMFLLYTKFGVNMMDQTLIISWAPYSLKTVRLPNNTHHVI